MSRVISGIVCALCIGVGLQAQVINVPGDFGTIQLAIDNASAGDVIQVEAGIYTENLLLSTPTIDIVIESVDGPSATVIQGAAVVDRPVIEIQAGHTSATVIQGFTITGANHTTPGVDTVAAQGGGIEVRGADPTIRGNRIVGNACPNGGAGILLYQSHSLVEKNVISGNSGDAGVGIRCEAATDGVYAPIIRNNDIYGNTATTTGGGIEVLNMGALSFVGNTVQGNSATTGGGMYVAGGSATIAVVDSVFWGNGASNLSGVVVAMITYCDIELGGVLVGVGGNIGSDPLFVDALAGDLRLGVGSLCIDAGVAVAGLTEDIAGNARDVTPDMGAHEVLPVPDPTGLTCSASGLDMSLAWTNVGTYDSIIIRRGVGGVAVSDYLTLSGTETSYLDAGLDPETYEYEVVGEVGTHLSNPTLSCSDTVAVPPVEGLGYTLGDLVVQLAWTNPYASYTGIEVYRDAALLSALPGSAESYQDSTVAVGTYNYEVRALYGAEAPASTSLSGVEVVVLPPSIVICEVVSGTQTVNLAWSNGATYDNVEILRDSILLATVSGAQTSYSDLTVPGAGTYTYEVRGVAGGGTSATDSCSPNVTYVPPVTIQSCTQVGDTDTVELIWSLGGVTYDQVRIERDGGTAVATLAGSATSHTTGSILYGAHNFNVFGVQATVDSAPAPCSETLGVPAPAFGTCVPAPDSLDVTLTWTNTISYDEVRVYRDGNPLGVLIAGEVTYTDTTLTAGGAYTYELEGVADGEVSTRDSCLATTTYVAPASGVTCTQVGDTDTVLLNWTNGTAAYDAVRIERDGGTVVATLAGSATSHTTGSILYGAHTFNVYGVQAGVDSAPAPCNVTLDVIAPAFGTCVPAPDSLNVTLNWTNPISYDQVRVYRNTAQIATLTAGEVTYTDTTLTVGGAYTYELEGVADGEVSTRDSCLATTTYVASASGVTCTQVGDTDTVLLNWTNGTATYDAVRIERDGGTVVATLAGSATSHTTGSILYGAHTFNVYGVQAGVDSAPAPCNVTLDVIAPAIGNCVAASDSLNVTLNWTNPISYDQVRVYRDGGLLVTLTAGQATYLDISLTVGGVYTYALEGVVDGEVSTQDTCQVTTTYVAPVSGVTCTQVGNTDTALLNWTNGTATYDAVRIERDGGTVVATLAGSAVTHTTGSIQYGAHTFNVYGVQAGVDSAAAPCNETLAVPAAAITSCAVAPDSLDVTVNWTNPVVYDEVRVYRDAGLIATISGTATSYTDTTLTVPGAHTYGIEGVADSELAPQDTCLATTTFVPPVTGLSCTQIGDTDTVLLGWTNGGAYDEVRVVVEGAETTLAGSATSHTTGAIGYGARAFSVYGVQAGVNSAAVPCNETLIVPAPAFGSCVPAADSLNVTLSWTNPTTYTEVRVYRDGNPLTTLTGSTYTDTTLTTGGSHTYELEGVADGELSTRDSCAVTTTYVAPVSALTCTQVGITDTVQLGWTNGTTYDEVRVVVEGVETTLAGSATSHTTGAIGYGARAFSVYGVQAGVNSASVPCNETLVVPAAAITSCAVAPDSLDVTVDWTNPASYDEVRVYRNAGLVATLAGTETSYTDTALTVPGTYTYAIEGVADGELASQDTCQAVTTYVPAVTGLTCAQVGTTDTVQLGWTNGGAYDEVRVVVEGVETTLAGSATSHTTGAIGYGARAFSVYGVQAGVNSASVPCNATLLVPAVTILSCTAAPDSLNVTATWLSPISYDEIRVYRDAGLIATIAGTEMSYTDTTLTLPGTYSYAIEGMADGEVAPQDSCQAASSFVPSVTGLSCVQVGDTDTVQLGWTNGTTYDEVRVVVEGVETTLAGSATSHTTGAIGYGARAFSVYGVQAGASSASVPCNATLDVPAPTFTSCVAATDGLTVDLQWTNPTSATYTEIRIYRGGAQIALRGGTETSFTDVLPVAGTYDYAVAGLADGELSSQATCQSTSDFVPPVGNLMCQAVGQTAQLTWDNGGTYEAVRIERGGALEAMLIGQPTSHTTGTLTYGTHDFSVFAIAAGVDSAPQLCSVTLDVPAPAFSSCTAAVDGLVANLSWTNAIAYTEVRLYRGGAVIATLGGAETTYTDALPAPGAYDYAVEGVADGEVSVQGTCQVGTSFVPPVVLTECTIGPDRVASLLWTNGTPGYEGIEVLIDGTAAPESPLAGDAVAYTSVALDPGPHTFTVRPFFGTQVATDAQCSSDAILPAPTGVTCAPVVDAWAVDLSWTNAYAYDSMTVYRNGVLVATLGAGVEAYTDPLPGPGSYDFQVIALLGSLQADPVACGPADVTYIPIPQLTSCTLTGAEATLSWSNLVTYDQLLVSRDGTTVATLGGAETTFSETLGSTGPRVYEVSGVITGFAPSVPATCTLTVEAPPPVSGLACGITGNDITLTWTNGAADYTAIEVRRNSVILDILVGDTTSYTDSSLPLGVYEYELRPLYALISSGTTASCQVDMSLLGPTNLECELTDTLAVSMTWANSDAYTTIQVLRDGELIAILPGTATTFNTALPDAGSFELEVSGSSGTSSSTVASCTVDTTITDILFKRGDSNADGSMNIADAIFSLNYSFRGGAVPPCMAAADTNGDQRVDVSDAIWSVNYLFLGGDVPPPPGPFCGTNPAPDGLSCDSYDKCPTGTP